MKTIKISLTLIFLLIISNSFAQVPGQLKSLEGARGSSLDFTMEENNYFHIKTDKSGGDSYSYWWNNNSKKCVTARVSDGKVASITATMPFDCNKGGTTNDRSYHHSSYHHNNGSHYERESVDQAYERGHNDGLHNSTYHNIYRDSDHKNAYSDGYSSGVSQRGRNTYHHSGRGGYHPHVQVNDLMGWKAVMAYDEMKQRGFVQQKNHSSGGYTYRVWYNGDTQQCIKTTSQNENITLVQVSTHCD